MALASFAQCPEKVVEKGQKQQKTKYVKNFKVSKDSCQSCHDLMTMQFGLNNVKEGRAWFNILP
jgi:hypothetical protein